MDVCRKMAAVSHGNLHPHHARRGLHQHVVEEPYAYRAWISLSLSFSIPLDAKCAITQANAPQQISWMCRRSGQVDKTTHVSYFAALVAGVIISQRAILRGVVEIPGRLINLGNIAYLCIYACMRHEHVIMHVGGFPLG